MLPHLHFATRAVYVVSGHSCGEKHFVLEHPVKLICSGPVIRKQQSVLKYIEIFFQITLFCFTFILAVFVSFEELESHLVKLIVLTDYSFVSKI